jgi:hypothetical protein
MLKKTLFYLSLSVFVSTLEVCSMDAGDPLAPLRAHLAASGDFGRDQEAYQCQLGVFQGLRTRQARHPGNAAITAAIEQARGELIALHGRMRGVFDAFTGHGGAAPVLVGTEYDFLGLSAADFARSLDAPASASVGAGPYNHGLSVLAIGLGSSPLDPRVNPAAILDAHRVLVAKYQPLTEGGAAAAGLASADPSFFALLTANRDSLSLLTDPVMVQICLGLLMRFDSGCVPSPFWFRMGDGRQVFLSLFSGTRGGQLTVDADRALADLRAFDAATAQSYGGGYGGSYSHTGGMPSFSPAPPARRTFSDAVLTRLTRIVTIDGREKYDVNGELEAFSQQVAAWFNLAQALYGHEVVVWEIKGPEIDLLTRGCDAAMARLAVEDGTLYSGVALGLTTVSLVQTTKEEKAEERADLRGQIVAHRQTRQSDIDAYAAVSGILPTLAQLRVWAERVVEHVSRHGRMT